MLKRCSRHQIREAFAYVYTVRNGRLTIDAICREYQCALLDIITERHMEMNRIENIASKRKMHRVKHTRHFICL